MAIWPFSDDRLRAMYPGARADATARRFARLWAAVFALGLAPRRWVTLEVAGRRSGRRVRFPLGMADWHGQWYLVPMLGEQCNWVQNVRAAGGRATLRHRRAVACRLIEVPVSERAPIIKRYLEKVPGARPHIPVDRHAPASGLRGHLVALPRLRVLPLTAAGPGQPARPRRWWRWILAGVAALVVLVVVAVAVFIKLTPARLRWRCPVLRQRASRPARRHMVRRSRIGGGLPGPGERPGHHERRRGPDHRRHRHDHHLRRPGHHGDVPHRPPPSRSAASRSLSSPRASAPGTIRARRSRSRGRWP